MTEQRKQSAQRAGSIAGGIGALLIPFVLWGVTCTHTKVAGYDSRLQQIELEIAIIKETRFKREDGERIDARSQTTDHEHEKRIAANEHAIREIPINLIDRFARVEERVNDVASDVREIKERLP